VRERASQVALCIVGQLAAGSVREHHDSGGVEDDGRAGVMQGTRYV
jgi:hypothetical protein